MSGKLSLQDKFSIGPETVEVLRQAWYAFSLRKHGQGLYAQDSQPTEIAFADSVSCRKQNAAINFAKWLGQSQLETFFPGQRLHGKII